MPLTTIIKSFRLIVHEVLGYAIMICEYRNNLLLAYASQKISMLKNNSYYIGQQLGPVSTITERGVINHIIIIFKVLLIPKTMEELIETKKIVFLEEGDDEVEEVEMRRFIEPCNRKLYQKLGCSCNDLTNLKFLKRNVEILLNDEFTCFIDPHRGYSIRRKRKDRVEEEFISEISSLENVYYSRESAIIRDAHFVATENNEFLGLASFLECRNVSVKTVYLDDNEGTVLYQRIILDDYKNQHSFILEHEFETQRNLNSLKRYFDISFNFNAKMSSSLLKPPMINKPIHSLSISNDNNNDYNFLKLDGVPATLKFYDNHFIVTNTTKSESFSHSLPEDVTHRLRDFSFVVETQLYKSIFKPINVNKPDPMAIIDLKAINFSAKYRMDIIQALKRLYADILQNYFIFFQDEKLINDNNDITIYPPPPLSLTSTKLRMLIKHFILFVKKKNETDQSYGIDDNNLLNHGKIYEVAMNDNYEIVKVIKERPDKLYPNSRKTIETIIEILNFRKF